MAVIEKRKSSRDGIVYRAKVRIKGYPDQTKTFRRLSDARIWVQEIEIALRDGKYISPLASQKHTVSELIDRYIETRLHEKSLSTQSAQLKQFTWWKEQIGDYYANSITPAILIECREKLIAEVIRGGKKRTGATANRFMSAIGHAFTIAWKEWQWLEQNPMFRISKLKESEGIVRYLDEQEKHNLLASCKNSKNPYLYIIVLLGISTGMRLNEIRSLTWKQIDFTNGSIILYNTKNKKPRNVPLQGKALEVLLEHSKQEKINNYLFPATRAKSQMNDFRRAWEFARDRAGLENFRFHDLRHTAASYYAMSGATARDLCDIFGWKTMQMAMRYAHLSESHTKELARKMNDMFL